MLAPGSRFGKFEILELLGSGAMGVVYKAIDSVDRIVALKTIREDVSASDTYRSLLTAEAKAAARIHSPHVVEIWDHGQIDNQLYISQEYVDGPDLRTACEVMSFRQKLIASRQLARGIAAAHQVGLVHRDLKPENIKITRDAVLKILDFGLARQVLSHDTEMARKLRTETLGPRDGFVGTICYASPEQLSGDQLTLRSDLFSAGIILYELFTGTRPFGAASTKHVVYSILNEAPASPHDVCTEVPIWLDQIILRMLAKRPVDRLESAEEMLRLLDMEHEEAGEFVPGGILRPRQTVTVIDLRNLSNDPSWEYFLQGFTEEVIREIGRRTNLVVTAQPAGIYSRNLQELADKCRSDFIITGSLLKGEHKIRMGLNIYRSRGLQLVSGETFESTPENLFELLQNAAVDVATKLSFETGSSAMAVDPLQIDVGAYEYYLKGRAYYLKNTRDDLECADTMFRRALEIDPNLSLAHAGLSDLYTLQYMFFFDHTPERIAKAREEALKALEMTPNLAEGYRSLGRSYQATGEYGEAELNLRKAIECNPKGALAYRAMAWLKEVQGDHEESMRWARKALELAPLDLETLLLIGILYMDTRKYTAALSTLQRAVELGPDYGRGHYELACVYMKIGALDEALTNYELACRFKGDPNAYIQAGYIHLVRQRYDTAREKFQTSLDGGYFPFVAAYFLGLLNKLRGDDEQAAAWFENSIRLGGECDPSASTNYHIVGYRALAHAAAGQQEMALNEIADLADRKEIDGESLYCIARAFALMNDPDKAAQFCQRALAAHAGPTESELRIDPHFRTWK